MSIGRTSVFSIGIGFLIVFLASSCEKPNSNTDGMIEAKQFTIAIDEVPARISGVWYHSKTEPMRKPVEMELSWGNATIGYWNALVIDLVGSRPLIGYADGAWNEVSIQVDPSEKNSFLLHMGRVGSPAKEEAKILITSNATLIFAFLGRSTAYTKTVNGPFYRRIRPSSHN